MATSFAEALQDAVSTGAEVEMSCDACGECWIVFVREGEFPTYEQSVCPIAGCPGEGEEL